MELKHSCWEIFFAKSLDFGFKSTFFTFYLVVDLSYWNTANVCKLFSKFLFHQTLRYMKDIINVKCISSCFNWWKKPFLSILIVKSFFKSSRWWKRSKICLRYLSRKTSFLSTARVSLMKSLWLCTLISILFWRMKCTKSKIQNIVLVSLAMRMTV